MNDDAQLLLRYARDHSEAAFAELVRRHIDLVYSAALRRCSGDSHRAEEVVQQVFTALANNSETLANHPALGAWLYSATRNAVINLAVAEQRRARREQEAVVSGFLSAEQSGPDWNELMPVLDEVMDELSEPDRTAVLMRFFQQRSFLEIGAAFNVSENTARMRTERAIEKLRLLMGKRGVKSTAAALGLVLARQAVVAAPAALAVVVTATILGIPKSSVVAAGAAAGRGVAKMILTAGAIVVVAVLVTLGVYQIRRNRTEPVIVRVADQAGTAEKEEDFAVVSNPVGSISAQPPILAVATRIRGGNSTAGPTATLPDLKAVEILQKMAAAYAALSSYQDSGEVVEKNQKQVESSKTTFQIYFRRSDGFRLDWIYTFSSTYRRTGLIWFDGQKVQSYKNTDSQPREEPSLLSVLATNISVSRGCSYHVPRFFIDKGVERYFSLAGLQAPLLVGEMDVEGVLCHFLRGKHPNGNVYELWIGKNDFLIRKIATQTPLSFLITTETRSRTHSYVEETHRDIRINSDIPNKVFFR